MQKTVLGAIV